MKDETTTTTTLIVQKLARRRSQKHNETIVSLISPSFRWKIVVLTNVITSKFTFSFKRLKRESRSPNILRYEIPFWHSVLRKLWIGNAIFVSCLGKVTLLFNYNIWKNWPDIWNIWSGLNRKGCFLYDETIQTSIHISKFWSDLNRVNYKITLAFPWPDI